MFAFSLFYNKGKTINDSSDHKLIKHIHPDKALLNNSGSSAFKPEAYHWFFSSVGFLFVTHLFLQLPKLSDIPDLYLFILTPITGFALAGLLLFGNRFIFIVIGSLLLSEQALVYLPIPQELNPASWEYTIVYTCNTSLQALLGAYLIRRYIELPSRLGYSGDIFKSMLLAGPLACLPVSILTISIGAWLFDFPGRPGIITWLCWWLGNSFSIVFILVPVFTFLTDPRELTYKSRALIILPYLVVAAVTIWIFIDAYQNEITRSATDINYAFPYSHHQSLVILSAGLLTSLMLCLLLYITVSQGAVTKKEVQARTLQLSEVRNALESEFRERRVAETEALKNSIRINAIMDHVADAIITMTRDGTIESFNRSAERIFGYAEAEIRRKNVSLLIPDLYLNKEQDALQNFLKHGKTTLVGMGREFTGQRKNGTLFSLDLLVNEMEIDQTKIYVGIARDITEKKQAADSLRKYKQALAEAGHAIFITDAEGIIEYVNAAFVSETGFSEDEAIGQNPKILKSGKMPEEYYKDFWNTIQAGFALEGEVINRRKNGELYYAQQTVSPILDKEGNTSGFIAVQQDISKTKEIQKLLKKSKEDAEAANKAKSEFLANISHEIRTPMNAVLGFSELLATIVDNPQQTRYLESIQSAGKSLLTLINDILDLSKIESGKLELQLEPVNIAALLMEIEQVFSAKIQEKNLELQLNIDPKLPPSLSLDESLLRQVLLNLVGNAVKFTDKGFIRLNAAWEQTADESRINLILKVVDSGIGIPEDQQQVIFESFKQQEGQSNRIYGGTGLGLTICKRLATMMGGSIQLESSVGVGSTFQLKLNRVEIADTALFSELEDSRYDLGNIFFDPATILIVDDVPSNRELLKASMSQVGFEHVEAQNGKQALDFATNSSPDIIFMDIRMPVMDGYETIRLLKSNEATRNIPVIAMTASVQPKTLSKIHEKGFDGYLSKPAPIKDVLKELSRFLPHKTTNQKKSPERNEIANISLDSVKNKSRLQARLESDLIPGLKNISGVMVMDDVINYGRLLSDIADEHEVNPLEKLAADLVEHAETFDISGIQQTITKLGSVFASMLGKLEQLSS